jgi:hypothetical protein
MTKKNLPPETEQKSNDTANNSFDKKDAEECRAHEFELTKEAED